MSQPRLIVTKEGKWFKCIEAGAVGMAIEGHGLTVLEAVGSWCIYSQTVQVRCDPPELLEMFSAKKVKKFLPAPTRS